MLDKQEEEKKMDPRIKRTRQLLQQALWELMQEKSFQAITVQDIAERATINRVTFYAHFEDKYALLEFSVREIIHQRLRGQVPEGTPFTPENLERLMLTVCEYLSEINRHCPPPRGQMDTLMEKQIKAELNDILHAWLAEMPVEGGRSRFSERLRSTERLRPSSEQAAMVASWAIYGAAVQWVQHSQAQSAQEYVRQVLPLILGSLQTSLGVPVP